MMGQVITATFVDGVLKPEYELSLTPGTKVRLILDLWDDVSASTSRRAPNWTIFAMSSLSSLAERRLTRDELHERR